MSDNARHKELLRRIRELESKISGLNKEMENLKFQENLAREKYGFYQLVADFTFGWELWFGPKGGIKYCSPSCYDLTGFTANQIISSSGIQELLVYAADQEKYADFLSAALNQSLFNQSLEFRILTRSKQLRWCLMNVRGVYDLKGKYLGIRASVQDVTRLKNAMGHISELEKGKQLEHRNKQRLQSQLELKDRELVSFLLQLSQKNELIAKASALLKQWKNADKAGQGQSLKQLKELLSSNRIHQLDWGMVESQIEKSHPGFIGRLQTRHPEISVKDQKLCSYIRLGLSSKEISGLLNITHKSVEIARVRLRKKLQIPSSNRLINYISAI